MVYSIIGYLLFCGYVLFSILYAKGISTKHRGFTHYLLALIVYSIPVLMIYPILVPYFGLGYFSHIFIDLFNKKNVQLFHPFNKGICFKLCYANKHGNKVLMYIGLLISLLFLCNGLFLHVGL